MSQENRCPQCGAELAADAPQGLCPACLLKRGLESQTTGVEADRPGAAAYAPPTPAELATLFPDLEILELVGRGGMGVVYKARQKRLDRLVALKILSPAVGKDPAFADRFAREARAMAMLSHPHIVAVYDFGQTISPLPPGEGQGEVEMAGQGGTSLSGHRRAGLVDEGRDAADLHALRKLRDVPPDVGLYYFLMEYVDGLNLWQLLDSGKLAPKEALAIVPQICEALQYAHDKGVVHRDIKPENVLLDKDGQVKIADFGLAKLMGREAKDFTLTGAGQVMGTPNYMAPEQIEHPQDVDHRADIYSLGVVFYQMLTGELPIGRFAPPSRKVQIDVRLDEVVLRALEKEPELRYQQASEIKTRVESIATTRPEVEAEKAPLPQQRPARESRMFGIPLVSVRDGRQVVYWPGVWLAAALLVVGAPLIVLLSYLSFAYVLAVAAPVGRHGPNPILLYSGVFLGFSLFFGWSLGFVMLVMKVREALSAPGDGSVPRDRTPPRHFVLKILCAAIGLAVLAAIVTLGPGQYRAYQFRRSFVAEMMRLLPATHVDEAQHRSGPLQGVEILDLAHSKYGEQGDRYVVQFKIVYDGLRTTSSCELVGDRWGRYCGEWGGHPDYPRMQIFVGNWGTGSLPSAGGQSAGANAAARIGFGLVVERTLEENDGSSAIDFAKGTVSQYRRNNQIVTRAEDYAIFRDWMQVNGMDAVGQADESAPIRGLAGVDMVVAPMRNAEWDNPSVADLWEGLAGGTPATPAPMTVAGVPPATFGFATRTGSAGILQIVGFSEKPKGVKIRYKLVQATSVTSSTIPVDKPAAVSPAAGEKAAKPTPTPPVPADPLQSPRAAAMRTVILAALEYATEHPEWPKTLDALEPKYHAAGTIDFGQFVYRPPGAESREKNPQEVAVLSEKEPAFAGGQLVGFADGYIEFIPTPSR